MIVLENTLIKLFADPQTGMTFVSRRSKIFFESFLGLLALLLLVLFRSSVLTDGSGKTYMGLLVFFMMIMFVTFMFWAFQELCETNAEGLRTRVLVTACLAILACLAISLGYGCYNIITDGVVAIKTLVVYGILLLVHTIFLFLLLPLRKVSSLEPSEG
ncbi:MAG: hypothetical protein HZC02_02665 [Candidatus Levybacteria bacterium]|nr:hypothetical protein [Candidatus Levybacteria bacterium]